MNELVTQILEILAPFAGALLTALCGFAINYLKKRSAFNGEISGCVFVADALHEFLQSFFVIRIFTVFHQSSDKHTQNPSEILMAGVGQEAPGIGQHTDEVAQYRQVGQ